MSRRSDVRDAIATELRTRLTGATVDVFLTPDYDPEELDAGPRVVVRSGGRMLEVDQGPDTRDVMIEIGVVGKTPARATDDKSQYRAAVVAAADVFDDLMESVIELWTPNGPLQNKGIAEHRFMGIEMAMDFDAKRLFDEGIWLSIARVTYQDSVDDED